MKSQACRKVLSIIMRTNCLQIANIIGVFSLVISILTAYPELFDATVMEMSGKDPIKRREIQRFIDNYGCFEGEVTYYEKTKQYLKKFLASL